MAKRWAVGFASVGAAALLAACGTDTTDTTAGTTPAQDSATTEAPAAGYETAGDGNSVLDVAASESDFSTLVEAVEAAGLTEALATSGPITLFAPTNAAFDALPDGTLDQLLLPENQDVLRQVLTYHVVDGEVPASAVTTGDVPSASGETIALQVDDATGDVMVNQAMVTEADIQASNGIIHAIDQVILPPGLAL
ncbi:fasciclin domain-containing protein [Nodosilinea sp. E11]|uniref:fasciclin domain-containing protein n=1 Tax=Nodosilinea sp. E11 TaxID=3037479 RepID=UPI002934303F|nr:fasciclin domain-containing protein [Nodosilinea sp. E11]WOD40082.1 fasciclin domain-containing protein [Nodosilinea sp. E11]